MEKNIQTIAGQLLTIILLLLLWADPMGAQTIVPTQTDEIIIDNGTSGKADPGDRIRYKVTIQNTGSPAGTGVQLNVVPDPRTTFVAGTFKSSPLALPDAYPCTGNVPIFVAAPGVKGNDFDEGAPATLSISTATNQATVRGGSVDIFADGSFEYTPPAGYEGDDSFTYTLNDATQAGPGAPVTDVGTVTITISGMIWFINNSAAAGDGRLSSPFNSLGAFNTANGGMTMNNGDVVNPEINETIFLYTGGGNYTGGITLLDGQRLFGQGATTANLGMLTGITFNPNSLTLPMAGGTRPVITNGAGIGLTLAQNNTLRGFNIGDTPTTSARLSGNNFGTLLLSEVSIVGTGQIISLINGTANATFTALTTTGTNQAAISLTSVAGSITDTNSSGSAVSGATGGFKISSSTVSLTYNGNVTHTSTDLLVNVLDHTSGIITFQNGTLVSTETGGLKFSNADGTYNFNGTTTLSAGSGPSGSARILIHNGSSGTFNFSAATSVLNPTSPAFSVLVSNANIDYNGTLSTNTTHRLIDLNSNTGGTITFDGDLNASGGNIGIHLNANTGGVYSFNGSSKTFSTTTSSPAVALVNNTGSTINITNGGLVIITTTAIGFQATGGGTVTVQGTGNTISSTSGTALNVANTTIGASGLTFESISSNGGSATGIILDNTGSSGGLTVTGTGSAGSGGTIANKTGANGSNTTGVGIYLNNCANVSLTRMQLNDFSNFGIRGFTVNNFTMDNCVVNHSSGKNGDDAATDEGSIYFGAENPGGTNGLTGTVSITNCIIEDGYENNFKIANLSGTLSQLTMTNCTIRDNSIASPGNNGFEIRAQGSANITADITNSTFTGNRANGIQVTTTPEHTGTVDVEIGVAGVALSGGTFTNNNIGINIAHGSPGILNFDIHRGTFNSSPGLASPININLAAGGVGGVGPMSGSITNNMITNANSGTGPGIRVNTNGTDADGSNVLTILVSNNIISLIGNRGIEMIARDGNSTLNATVTNNTVTLTDPLAADAIRIDAGTSSGDLTTVCLAISGNTATTIAGSNGIRIRNRFAGTTYRIPGYGGAATDPDGTHDAVIAYLSSLNPLTPMVTADHQVGNSGFTAGSPCATPN